MGSFKLIFLFFVFHFCLNTIIFADVELIIKKFRMCEEHIYPVNININFTKNGVYDIVDMDFILTVSLDNSYVTEYTIERSTDGEKYRKLLTTKNKLCTSLKMNFGDFVYKPMTAAGIPSRCPIPPGHYSLHNYTVDLRTFPLQHFPIGHMKLSTKLMNKDNQEVHCSVTTVQIKIV